MLDILDYAKARQVELPTLLAAVSCNTTSMWATRQYSAARRWLYNSPLLPHIAQFWLRHAIKDNGPQLLMRPLILTEICTLFNQELARFDDQMSGVKPSHDNLSSFDFQRLRDWMMSQEGLPNMWRMMTELATPKERRDRNTSKDPCMVC